MKRLCFLILLLIPLQTFSQSAEAQGDLIGKFSVEGIRTQDSGDDKNSSGSKKKKEDLFSSSSSYRSMSRAGTGLSIFATGLVHVTGINPVYVIDIVTGTPYSRTEPIQINRNRNAGDLMMFLGTFSATLANYQFGNKNDILALLPMYPVTVSSIDNNTSGFRESSRYMFQLGFFFYFSRDF